MNTIKLGTMSAAIGSSYMAIANQIALRLESEKSVSYFIDGVEVDDEGNVIIDVLGSKMRSLTLYQFTVPHNAYGEIVTDSENLRFQSLVWHKLQRHFEIQCQLLRGYKSHAV